MDYDAQEIHLAEVTQNNVTPSPVRFDSASTACSKLSRGTIAAIVLGSLVGLALLAGLGYWFLRRKKRRSSVNLKDKHRPMVMEREPSLNTRFEQYELPVERRISELPSPNGGLPPPSPRAPYSHPPVLAMPVLPRGRAPSQASTRSDSPNSFLSTQETHTGINQS